MIVCFFRIWGAIGVSEPVNIKDLRNRITEVVKMRLGDIAHNPVNWRGHPDNQREAFRGIAREIGWAGVPLVYQSERTGTLTYLDGHMRKEEVPDLEAEVAITDLNDEEADLFLATYDPLGTAAIADREKLGALLQSVQTGEAGVQALLGELAEREGLFELIRQGEKQPGNDEGEESGTKLSLLDITIEEPQHEVERGQVWKLGNHILVCDEVLTGWEQWVKYLKPGDIFAPFPGPFVPLTIKAEKMRVVMVQPDPYIAGHIIDRWVDVNGEDGVSVD